MPRSMRSSHCSRHRHATRVSVDKDRAARRWVTTAILHACVGTQSWPPCADLQSVLDNVDGLYHSYSCEVLRSKLGLQQWRDDSDMELVSQQAILHPHPFSPHGCLYAKVDSLFAVMREHKLDYTNTFRALSDVSVECHASSSALPDSLVQVGLVGGGARAARLLTSLPARCSRMLEPKEAHWHT